MASAAPVPPEPAGSLPAPSPSRWRLAPEGRPFVLAPLAAALFALFLPGPWSWLAAPGIVFAVFSAWFFRDPDRAVPADPELLLAPADGLVTEAVTSPEGVRVTIFLNIFNVHINRSPAAGKITAVRHHPGRFLAAFRPEAPLVNERNEVSLSTPRGPVRVVQVAGLLARRIVCRVRAGDQLAAGERFGLIRFGSSTQLFLPPGAALLVEAGRRVRGGVTPLARWPETAA